MNNKREKIDQQVSTFLSQLQPQASSSPTHTNQASLLLRDALLEPATHKIWSRYISDNIATDKNVLSYRAISRAISASEWSRYGIESPPNRYKDRVRRAILGDRLTIETLRLFTETFPIDPHVAQKISELIAQSSAQETPPDEKRIPRFDITTTLYDIYVNRKLRTYKIRCNLVFRALEDSCDYLWAPVGTDIKNIEIHHGASLRWHEKFNMYSFELDTPLNTSECGELLYTINIDDVPDESEDAIMAIQFGIARSSVFFRFFFDEPDEAPIHLTISRKSTEKNSTAPESLSETPVHDGRASVYFDRVRDDLLLFY